MSFLTIKNFELESFFFFFASVGPGGDVGGAGAAEAARRSVGVRQNAAAPSVQRARECPTRLPRDGSQGAPAGLGKESALPVAVAHQAEGPAGLGCQCGAGRGDSG